MGIGSMELIRALVDLVGEVVGTFDIGSGINHFTCPDSDLFLFF
jgi:hypothetical protein